MFQKLAGSRGMAPLEDAYRLWDNLFPLRPDEPTCTPILASH
jgi:hypothetical protein